MSEKPELRRGDVFVSYNPWFIGKAIIGAERFWSYDGKAEYGHAGLILNRFGQTFEALSTYKQQDLWRAYEGKKLKIARPSYPNRELMDKVMDDLVAKYYGKTYPAWRLALHLFPPLARKFHRIRMPVCSELVAIHLKECGVRASTPWGVTPDILDDEWTHHKYYTIIHQQGE